MLIERGAFLWEVKNAMFVCQGHPTDRFCQYLCICLEDLLSLTIFRIKCGEKSGVFFSSNFCDMGNLMPVSCFRRDKNVILGTKKASYHFWKSNSSLQIRVKIFLTLEFSEV